MELSSGTVRPEWLDYNGHLYDGYYAVIFTRAVDELLDRVGLDAAGRQATGRTIYTLEMHVRFLAEMKLGAPYRITMQVLDLDHKRLRIFLFMQDTARGLVAATSEQMLISIDKTGEEPRSAPWLEDTAAILAGMAEADAGLAPPDGAGKAIAIRR